MAAGAAFTLMKDLFNSVWGPLTDTDLFERYMCIYDQVLDI